MAVRSTVTSIGALILMFVASWKLSLLLFILAPILILPLMSIGRRVRKLSVHAQDRIAAAAGEATETLDAIDLVQAYGMEKEREHRFRDAVEASFRAALARINARAFLTGFIIALMFAGVTGIVWLGALGVMSGQMTAGAFIQFVLLAIFGVGGFATVAEVFGDAMRASGAAERAIEILEQTPDIAAPPNPKPMPAIVSGDLRLDNLSFSYPGSDVPSLRSVSFRAKPGELVALVGPSGAGKSTVFRMLLRFFDPTEGAVLLDGMDAREVDPAEWRARFSYVPQEAPIFSGDAYDNVRFGRQDASEEEARAALQKSEAWHFLESRGGLAAEVGSKGPLALRRRTPAHRHRPRAGARRAGDAAGRSHLGARRQQRAAGAEGAGTGQRRPHHAGHRPPPRHCSSRQPHRGDGRRPRDGGGRPRKPRQGRRPLRQAGGASVHLSLVPVRPAEFWGVYKA